MDYFLCEKNILFKDKHGQICCVGFEHNLLQSNENTNFIQKNHYDNLVTSISEIFKKNRTGKERETIILNTYFLEQPGLTEAIEDKLGKDTNVKSEIELQLSIQKLPFGEYTFIEISRELTSTFIISIQGDSYSIIEYNNISNDSFKHSIINSLKTFLQPNTDTQRIFEVIFNYSNIIAVNNLMSDKKYGLVGNETAYNERNLYYKDSAFKNIFTADLLLPDFFKIITNSITTQISNISANRRLIIQSPLLDYQRVNKYLSQNENLMYISKLQQFFELKSAEITVKKSNSLVNFELHPTPQKNNLPFSSWILTETNNLILNFKFHQKNYEIDIAPLSNELAITFFSLANKSLLKYLIHINENSCGHLQLKLKGLNGVEYFKTINR